MCVCVCVCVTVSLCSWPLFLCTLMQYIVWVFFFLLNSMSIWVNAICFSCTHGECPLFFLPVSTSPSSSFLFSVPVIIPSAPAQIYAALDECQIDRLARPQIFILQKKLHVFFSVFSFTKLPYPLIFFAPICAELQVLV